MTHKIINQDIGHKSESWLTFISDFTFIGIFVHLLDLVIKIGRHFPLVSISMVGLNLLLAVNDFVAQNIAFAILNSLFAISGLVFLLQMHLMGKIHKNDLSLRKSPELAMEKVK